MSELSELHSVTLSARNKVSITGITDVGNFDESVISCKTDEETLTLRGTNLHIDKLDVDAGILEISGYIFSLVYSDGGNKNESIWEKIFK